jgi:hypothetical protein
MTSFAVYPKRSGKGKKPQIKDKNCRLLIDPAWRERLTIARQDWPQELPIVDCATRLPTRITDLIRLGGTSQLQIVNRQLQSANRQSAILQLVAPVKKGVKAK